MKHPFKIKIWVKLQSLFIIVHVIWHKTIALAADKPMSEKLTDPLYWITLVFMVMYGLLTWSLSRNLKGIDAAIKQVDAKIDREIKQVKEKIDTDVKSARDKTCEVNSLLKDERERINELSGKFNALKGSHDAQVALGGHRK